ncbi:MAG: SpoVR family protein [Bdellovibrionales bacterium]
MSKSVHLIIATLFLAMLSMDVWATEDKGTPMRLRPVADCDHILGGKQFRVILSGSESMPEKKELTEALHDLLADGGLFDRLGIDRPYQTIRFIPGGDLNIIGGLNNIPVAHWKDGAQVAKTSSRGLLYELVIPGKTEHHSFYRADNTFEEQLSILFHALAGHVHVAMNSRFKHDLDADPINEAYALSEYMDQLRQRVSGDAVSRWYQYLLSFDYAQDLINANYQTPDQLKVGSQSVDPFTKKPIKNINPTSNILQAFVANLPSDMPDWQKEMARRFERLRRYIPGAVKTKILHEGYSTLMQEILPKHTKYSTFEHGIKYCCLLAGVAAPSIQNPYWIGTEAWRNIYKRFLKRPEIEALASLEAKDKAFIAYAKKEVIGKMDDAMFLRFGLDADWVARNNFALTRPYKENEYNPWYDDKLTPPDPRDPKRNWPYTILTRDPDKVIGALVSQLTGSIRYQHPNVELISMNDQGSGQVALELSDLIGRSIALNKESLVETLYVMAQMHRRPVSLESTFDIDVATAYTFDEDEESDLFGGSSWGPMPRWHRQQPLLKRKARVKVVVTPKGEVQAFEVKRSGSSAPTSLPDTRVFFDPSKHTPTYEPLQEITTELTKLLDRFIVNLDIEQHVADKDLLQGRNVLRALDAAVDAAAEGASHSLSMAVPTSSRALMEYLNFLGRRLNASLKYAIHGKGKLIRTAQGVKISALPKIPYFHFDRESLKKLQEESSVMPLPTVELHNHMRSYTYRNVFRPEDLTDINSVPGNPGDVHWGPNPKSGQGDGSGDQPGGKDASDDGGSVQFENVSLETYAEALAEEIELPNLRPKIGPVQKTSEEMRGNRRQQTGISVKREILRKAFKRGMPTQEEMEENPDAVMDNMNTVKRGLSRLRPERDWVVKDFSPIPDPDINALVVFEMDMSGSMEFVKREAKQMLYDLRAILMRKYKKVKFLYVVFNSEATMFEDPEKFFAFQPNGGTVYSRGWEKALELYEAHPESQWDRFTVTVGDMYESFGPKEQTAFTNLKEASQFITTLSINDDGPGSSGDLEDFLRGMADSDPYVGFAKVSPPSSYTPLIFREAFKNKSK